MNKRKEIIKFSTIFIVQQEQNRTFSNQHTITITNGKFHFKTAAQIQIQVVTSSQCHPARSCVAM